MSVSRRASYTGERLDIQALVTPDAKRILDVGCSNGSLGAALRKSAPDRIVFGLEFDLELSREAATKLDQVYLVDLNQYDWQSISDEPKFDCIIFADVLEHLVNPDKVLRGAVQCLADHGSVIISVPNIRHVSAFWSIYIRGSFPRNNRGIFDDTHLRWFTLHDIKKMARSSGLTVRTVASNLRLLDTPVSKINSLAEKALRPFANLSFIREFFSYQFIIKADYCATPPFLG